MKISIVTPSLNQAEYLNLTINSVLQQNYPKLQYVIIDGCSTDGSPQIIKSYAKQLAYYASEPDEGHYDAINKGFQYTDGEIMAWINSSDVYYPWTLQVVSDVFRDNPEIEWISGIATHLDRGTYPNSIVKSQKNKYDILSGNYKWLQQESMFWRRTLWDKVGGKLNTDCKYVGDFELWLRFFEVAELFYVNTILGGFRHHHSRRGSTHNYHHEAAQCFSQFRKNVNKQDIRRSYLIKLLGTGIRKAFVVRLLKKVGFCKWYRHPEVLYEYKEHRWGTNTNLAHKAQYTSVRDGTKR